MKDAHDLYRHLMSANQDAFADQFFMTAYHSLSAAMHYAMQLKDAQRIAEVECRAHEQWQGLLAYFSQFPPANEPLELTLFNSLRQLAKMRSALHADASSARI